jgi:hypothetical protein
MVRVPSLFTLAPFYLGSSRRARRYLAVLLAMSLIPVASILSSTAPLERACPHTVKPTNQKTAWGQAGSRIRFNFLTLQRFNVFYPVFFDFVLTASRLARALRISGFPSAQALSIVIRLKRHLSRSRVRLQS